MEREIGWSHVGKEVFKLTRQQMYDEKIDEYYWKVIEE